MDQEVPGGQKIPVNCEHKIKELCKKHDSYFCVKCGEWTEQKCKDPECEFCKDRPEKHETANHG